MDFYLTNLEIITILSLSSILFLSTRLIKLKKNAISIINPIFIYSLIIFYYAIISPIYKLGFGSLLYREINFRNLLIYGWIGALISTIFIFLGYFLTGKKRDYIKKQVSNMKSKKMLFLGITINLFAFISYQIAYGFNLSVFIPFIRSEGILFDFLRYKGAFSSYLGYSQDLLISGNMLILVAMLRTKKWKLIFFLSLLLTSGIFLTAGFRYRLFFLFFSLLFYYLIYTNKNIKVLYKSAIVGLLSITFLNSFVEIVRVYGQGFNFSNLKQYTFSEFITNIFQLAETGVFLTTAAVIKYVPDYHPYVYLYPFYKVLIHPLPSSFFDKNPGDYIKSVLSRIYGSETISYGAAMHNFGEYYLMGGWIGIIVLSLMFGFVLKKLWIWGNLHKDEPLGLAVYVLNVSFIFMIISRGYLPQQALIYAFSILPINLIYFFNSQLIKNKKNLI